MITVPRAGELLRTLESEIQTEEGKYNHVRDTVLSLRKDKQTMEEREMLLRKCITIIQRLAELKKEETTKKVERLVSFGLQTVFGNPTYTFHIHSEVSRDIVSYNFTVKHDGVETDILDASGGGLVNVVSFLLRLIVVVFIKGYRRVLVLDEPFSNLSEDFQPNVGKLLSLLSQKTGVQIIMVSHQPNVEPDDAVIYNLTKESGHARLASRG